MIIGSGQRLNAQRDEIDIEIDGGMIRILNPWESPLMIDSLGRNTLTKYLGKTLQL